MPRDEDFFAISADVFEDPNLDKLHKWLGLYTQIIILTGSGFQPTQKALSKVTGLSRPTIRKRIKHLIEAGLLETNKVGSKITYTILPYEINGKPAFVNTQTLSDEEFETFKEECTPWGKDE